MTPRPIKMGQKYQELFPRYFWSILIGQGVIQWAIIFESYPPPNDQKIFTNVSKYFFKLNKYIGQNM